MGPKFDNLIPLKLVPFINKQEICYFIFYNAHVFNLIIMVLIVNVFSNVSKDKWKRRPCGPNFVL